MEKNELLSNLYTLRAGLSQISVEKDKASSEQNSLDSVRSNAQKKTEKLKSEKKELKDWIELQESFVSSPRSIDKAEIFYAILWFLGTLVCSIIVIDGFISGLDSFSRIVVALAFVGLGIFFLVKGIIRLAEEISDYKNGKENQAEAPAEILTAKNQISSIEKQLTTYRNQLNSTETRVLSNIAVYTENANKIYDIIVKEYTPILDIRDWQNLDLIIFYIETGRADSIKEALQQVDRQIQTDTIVYSINQASYQIQNTIQQGFAELQTTMVRCFSHISMQLDGINTQLSNVKSSIDFGNSLKEKANATSEQLMQDVHYMRTLSENADIRQRNR